MKTKREERLSYQTLLFAKEESEAKFDELARLCSIKDVTYKDVYNAIVGVKYPEEVYTALDSILGKYVFKYVQTAIATVDHNLKMTNYNRKCIQIRNCYVYLSEFLNLIRQYRVSLKFLTHSDAESFEGEISSDILEFLYDNQFVIDLEHDGDKYFIDCLSDAFIWVNGLGRPLIAAGLYKNIGYERKLLHKMLFYVKDDKPVFLFDKLDGKLDCLACDKECCNKYRIIKRGTGTIEPAYEYCQPYLNPKYCIMNKEIDHTGLFHSDMFNIIMKCVGRYMYYAESKKQAKKSNYGIPVSRKVSEEQKVYVSCTTKDNTDILVNLDRDFKATVKRECIAYGTGTKHSHHESPCAHYRKGYVRITKTGKVVNVRPTIVNPNNDKSDRTVTYITK